MTNLPPSTANLRGAVDLSSLVRPTPTASASGGANASTDGGVVPSLVIAASDASFTGILDLSKTVPVVVELHAGAPSPSLAELVVSFGGRIVLATVEAATSPQLQQAFQAQVAPTVAAVVGGRPLALYEGELPSEEARQVLEQLLTLAAQNGVTGTVTVEDAPETSEEPAEQPLPPHHQDAYDAIDRGDYEGAIGHYRTAIAQDPRDALAVAGLAQVSLLARLTGTAAEELRSAAAMRPADVEAQVTVADLDVSGGHLDNAFDRLLDLFPSLDAEAKNLVRTRLLDYFEIAGADDPRVAAARRRLTMLLY